MIEDDPFTVIGNFEEFDCRNFFGEREIGGGSHRESFRDDEQNRDGNERTLEHNRFLTKVLHPRRGEVEKDPIAREPARAKVLLQDDL